MKRTLSSTPGAALFVSRIVGGVIGLGSGLFVINRLRTLNGDRWEFTAAAMLMILVVCLLIVADLRLRRSFKHVAVDDRFLYVSREPGSGELAIPLEQIVGVTQRRGKLLRPVSIYLRSAAACGSRIRFQPPREAGFAWKEDAVVRELRSLAKLS